MGAEVPYEVRVLVLVEATIEVSAVTSDEAAEKAMKEPGVARVLSTEIKQP